jgi:hypothetical protein
MGFHRPIIIPTILVSNSQLTNAEALISCAASFSDEILRERIANICRIESNPYSYTGEKFSREV